MFSISASNVPSRRLMAFFGTLVVVVMGFFCFKIIAPAANAAPSTACDNVSGISVPTYYMAQTNGAKFGPEITASTTADVLTIAHQTWCTDPVNATHAVAVVKNTLDGTPFGTTAELHAQSVSYVQNRNTWVQDVSNMEDRLKTATSVQVHVVGGTYHTFGQQMNPDGVPDLVSTTVTRPSFMVITWTFADGKSFSLSLLCHLQLVQLQPITGPSPLGSPPSVTVTTTPHTCCVTVTTTPHTCCVTVTTIPCCTTVTTTPCCTVTTVTTPSTIPVCVESAGHKCQSVDVNHNPATPVQRTGLSGGDAGGGGHTYVPPGQNGPDGCAAANPCPSVPGATTPPVTAAPHVPTSPSTLAPPPTSPTTLAPPPAI